jgi:branched-chain amino acid transport system substrate-binding protein
MEVLVLDSKALTKLQSVALIVIVVVAAVSGGIAYVLWSGGKLSGTEIRIGVCGDLDNVTGKAAWQGAVLAAEQINAEGGVLGRNFTIVAEDDDSETPPIDIAVATNAMTKLLTVDHADYAISSQELNLLALQDISAKQKKILFAVRSVSDELTQRVLDDYDKYKYFFRIWSTNVTSAGAGFLDCVFTLGEYTNFTKVAYLIEDFQFAKAMASALDNALPDHGFDIVYRGTVPPGTTDFTSYFAAIEASGAEILVPIIVTQAATPFVKEYYDRQSPFVVWGNIALAQESDFYELTEGKSESVSFVGLPVIAGFPLTSRTVPTREAYLERWGEVPNAAATAAYDTVRFILPDAIKRAGTTETEAVIKALEKTDIETSMARRFVFTSSHDVLIGAAGPNKIGEDYMLVCLFQWQNGTQVPVYPKEIMEEAGATYTYPEWAGPWK